MHRETEHYWVYDFRDAVWESDLSAHQRLVLLAMSRDCDWRTGKNARPGMKRLRKLTSLSERTITRVRQQCVDAGWLVLEEMGSQKDGGRPSTYTLTLPTPATESGVPGSTPAKPAATPAKPAHDPCQVGDLPRKTTTDHRAGFGDPTNRAVAANGFRMIRGDR